MKFLASGTIWKVAGGDIYLLMAHSRSCSNQTESKFDYSIHEIHPSWSIYLKNAIMFSLFQNFLQCISKIEVSFQNFSSFPSIPNHFEQSLKLVLDLRSGGGKPLPGAKKCPPRHFQVPFELYWKLHLLNSLENPAALDKKHTIKDLDLHLILYGVIIVLIRLNWPYHVFLSSNFFLMLVLLRRTSFLDTQS